MMILPPVLPTLRARWVSVVLTCILVVAAVVALSLALPPRYEATSMVVVEMNGADPIAGQAAYLRQAGQLSGYIATQADILRSEEVARRALRKLGLHEDPQWRAQWEKATQGATDLEPWIAAQLLRRLDVRPSREANVITVAYTDKDARFAASVANAMVESYIDTTLQMRVGPARRFNVFFEERAKSLREALEQARAKLSAYEKQHGVIVGEDDTETARLTELNTQLVALQDAAAEAANARKQAGASPGGMREVRSDPEVAALTSELVRAEGRLAELRADFGERHHAVVQAREALSDVRGRLAAATRRAAQTFEAPVKVSQARLAEARAAVERQRELVMKRKTQRDAAAALIRDVESAQKAYDAVLERASQTALESANTTQTSISVLKNATAPLDGSASLLVRNVIVALLLGLLLGIARAMLAEMRDRRLRTVEDVVRRLQQPLLLALPDGHAGGDQRAEQTRQRLVGGRPRLAAPKWLSLK